MAQWTGQRLIDARIRRGWTQSDLAERIGAGLRTVGAWEQETSTPTLRYQRRLNELLAERDDAAGSRAVTSHHARGLTLDTSDGPVHLESAFVDMVLDAVDFDRLLSAVARRYELAAHERPASHLKAPTVRLGGQKSGRPASVREAMRPYEQDQPDAVDESNQ